MNWIKPISYIIVILIINSAQGQTFLEQSTSIGIDHEFQNRALMGGGAVFFDYDLDGDEDLYCTSGLKQDVLYINNGDGTFDKDRSNNGLAISRRYNTMGASAADIDNDGDRDLFVTTWEWYNGQGAPIARNLLFINNGDGTFDELGEDYGLLETAFSTGATFFDYNKDGFLDLYVINYVDVPGFKRDEDGNVIGFASECYENFFYLNNGDGSFTDYSDFYGVDHEGCTLAVIASDYDLDQDMDLYVANDYGPDILPNVFYENKFPVDTFEETSMVNQLNIAIYSMGVASADYDHDLDPDYYVTNLGKNALMRNDGGIFTHVSDEAQVGNEWVDEYTFTTGWGAVFGDFNNDSWEDLYVSNGRIASIPSLPTSMNDPNKLFLNNGDGTFSDVGSDAGVENEFYGRGVATSDFDQDGDLDFFTVHLEELGGVSKMYVNKSEELGHYFRLQLIGVDSNKDAIGAKAYIYSGDQILFKEVYGGGSFCAQSSLILHYGLGEKESIDSVKIIWPSDHIDVFTPSRVDTLYQIEEYMDFNSSTKEMANPLNQIKVFPNPATDVLNVDLGPSVSSEFTIQLISLQGSILGEWKIIGNRKQIFLPSSVTNGIYFVALRSKDHTFYHKVIITH
ncbi:MAG: T9SS type A sorting domain-containing protein [Saprospiraceae bacterium]|nr:T9SS type A sorting domain-containing protein [Saprospiraceae bacterium]